jgi:uncharacterized protein with von Willebrand factor type A (vWA) domain
MVRRGDVHCAGSSHLPSIPAALPHPANNPLMPEHPLDPHGQVSPAGGIIHTYQKYDPGHFPSPTAAPPDLASAAFEHMMRFGSMRRLTPEELARAVHLDISQIAGLGPSLESLIEMLLERKRKILATWETQAALREAAQRYRAAAPVQVPDSLASDFHKAVREEQIVDFERLWYKAAEGREGENGPLARGIMRLMERLGEKYQVEELASRYDFTGRQAMDVPKALEIKEELEAIDRLLEQLREAMKNAQIAVIDMDELARFAQQADVEQLQAMQQQMADYLRQQAELQGLEETADGYRLTPEAYRIFQGKLLQEIFSSLEAARSGRHEGAVVGEGAVELPTTKPYEFGDSVAHMDVGQSFVNALLRAAGETEGPSHEETKRRLFVTLKSEDIEIHRTRNNPKCATCVMMDMSGSMRYDGQYMNAKRMAIALDGLIRREYPGDFLSFLEIYTFARLRHISEVPSLLPKPVTTHAPIVRLKADMSSPEVSEVHIPPHFTNIQHALQLARQQLAVQDTPNRQILLLTDGLPTAHFEGSTLYLLYPPDPRTEEATMREAMRCHREGITINIFLLPSWWQSSEDISFAHRMAEQTGGRVFFTAGRDVDRYVLWDYVNHRRKIIG